MRVCPDCNGKGVYQGFTTVGPCDRCRGVGKLDVTKEDALQSMLDFNAPRRSADITHLINPCKDIDIGMNQLPRIVVGTAVYIYAAGWHETFVVGVFSNFFKTENACETFRIPKDKLTYNLTQNRWEHIRHGTPVWH